jgi:acetyl-CoA carboxylase biotin carboxylase subunit
MSRLIKKLFIANRGEIALRIIRSCQPLGIETVLGVSAADQHATPAQWADSTVLLGPAPAAESYLDIARVVAAAHQAGADALHPGYGFLSEKIALAEACAVNGIVFVGPTPAQLLAVGDKLRARQAAEEAGLPLVPGAAIATAAEAETLARRIGLPVLLKAVGGGGGRGMKVVRDFAALAALFTLASAEARAAFADERLYMERYVENGRHVEVQVLGDGVDVVHFGTRDCSVQRRYQKLIEEAPAPALKPETRAAIEQAAVTFAKHLAYQSAGTVEFLYDCDRDAFYFLEMNARIQVEHPVTEMICGVDLIAQQLRIAEGRQLGLRQQDVQQQGHSIECRLNAEDPANDFMPSPGLVSVAVFPAGVGVRVDTHIEAGSVVPPHYDSLLAKLIVHGSDRADAVRKMQRALARCKVEGVATNIALLQRVLAEPAFVKGGVTTSLLPTLLAQGSRL